MTFIYAIIKINILRRIVMKIKQFYQVSIIVATAIFAMGCSYNNKPPAPKPQKQVKINKPVRVAPPKPSGITLSQLNSGGITTLAIKGPHRFKEGQPIKFIIDTRGAEGYLYVVYSDSNGEVGVLYPNPKSPLTEISGKYIFPDDFGTMVINATKDCKGCKEDKTVVYALLTKEPILDIRNINQTHLKNILGGQSLQTSIAKTKGISMSLDSGRSNSNANVNIGVLEFVVE